MKHFSVIIIILITAIQLPADIPDPLRVACIPDIYPMSFLNDDGEPDGAFPRVIEEIARQQNINIEWSISSWAENLDKARNGELDLMIALVFTPERNLFLDYSNQFVLSTWSQLFKMKEGPMDSILDIEGKRIGMMSGDQNARGFVDLAESFNITYQAVYYDNFDIIYRELAADTIDAGVFYNLYNLSRPDLIQTSIIFQPNHAFFAIPEGADNEILRIIDDALLDWKADEDSFYFREITSLINGSSTYSFPKWLKYLIPGLFLLILYILFWTWLLKRQVRQRTIALLNAQEGYRSTFTEADVGIFHIDSEGSFLRVNPGFCTFLGFNEQALLKKNIFDIGYTEESDDDTEPFKDVIEGKRSSFKMDKRYIAADGSILWCHLTISGVRGTDDEFRYMVGITEDITSRKNAEHMIDDLQKRYRGVFENSYQMTALFDSFGGLLDINDTLKRVLNLKDSTDNLSGKTPSDIEMFGPIGSLRIQEMVDDCLTTGQTIKHVIGFEETSDELAVEVTVKPIVDENGNILYCISEAHDITDMMKLTNNLELQVEERTRDIREAHNQLVEAEKMASLGRLVAGIAHEINTPVGVAKTGVSYLKEQVESTQKKFKEQNLSKEEFSSVLATLGDLSEILEQNLDRAIKLIRDFKMTSADQSSHEIREVPIKEYMEAVMHSLTPRFKQSSIRWTVNASDEESPLHVGVMNQILLNLTINSLNHAYNPGEEGQISIDYRLEKNRRILEFRDDGCGIPMELQDRIFEPFFTTGRGKGHTGLGLSIIYNLVNDVLKGEIKCISREGAGTTFIITCPDLKHNDY